MMNYLQKKKKAMLNYVSGITPPLPSEYQQVEWIGSSGTQYINTDYKPSSDTEVELVADIQTSQNNVEIIGTRENSRYYEILFYPTTNTNTVYLQFGTASLGGHTDYLGKHKYEIIGGGLYFDESLIKQSYSTFNQFATRTIFIFALNNGNAERKITANLYGFKLTENGTIERDMIPCYHKTSGEIGMYDLIGRQFYTNSGSGDFTKGQDV